LEKRFPVKIGSDFIDTRNRSRSEALHPNVKGESCRGGRGPLKSNFALKKKQKCSVPYAATKIGEQMRG